MCLTCKTFASSCENDNEWFDLNLFITFWELFAWVDTSSLHWEWRRENGHDIEVCWNVFRLFRVEMCGKFLWKRVLDQRKVFEKLESVSAWLNSWNQYDFILISAHIRANLHLDVTYCQPASASYVISDSLLSRT